MGLRSKRLICPICNLPSIRSSKWVSNRYGERYEYFVFKHGDISHYYNKASEDRRLFKKGELESKLIEVINSDTFRDGIFRIADLKKALTRLYPNISTNSIRSNLLRLSKKGIIEVTEKNRKIFFVNLINKGKLNYAFSSMKVRLEDISNNLMFSKHISEASLTNDKEWPLYYLHIRIVGDIETNYEDLELKAYDVSKSKEMKIILIENNPKEKRILLKFPDPIPSGETREIKWEYYWEEVSELFTFSTATRTNIFEFSILSNNETKLLASMTNPNRNETRDLSKEIIKTRDDERQYISHMSIKDIEPFSVIQMKWEKV